MDSQVSIKPVESFRAFLETSTEKFNARGLYDELISRLDNPVEVALQQVVASLAVPTLVELFGSQAAPSLFEAPAEERAVAYLELFEEIQAEEVASLWSELDRSAFSDTPAITPIGSAISAMDGGIAPIGYLEAFDLDISHYASIDKDALRQVLCLLALTSLTVA